MKKIYILVFVALLISVLGAGIKKTLYRDYGIVVFHPDSLISVRAHQIVWGNLWVIQSDSTDTMSMTPDVFTIDTVIVTDYLYSTDDVQFDSTLTFGSGAVFSQPHADTIILTEGNIILTGKIRAGSFGTPLDVTSNRVYGAELHYYGNNYNVTALRARAQFKTTDATGDTAIGALIQAANNDGINASVLNGAKIEAIGKSTTTGARIGTMRGLLVNTEWSAKDTITDLRILHLRTHTRDATADGCVDGTSYGLYIENEAVGGNGQALDAGIYLDGTNLSAGNKAFTYGADFSGVATDIGTADFRFRSGGLIDNPHADTFTITEANVKYEGKLLSGGNMWMQADTMFFTDGGADTSWVVNNGSHLRFGGDLDIQFIKAIVVTTTAYFEGKITCSDYRWYIDSDDDNATAQIWFHGTDKESFIADSAGQKLWWTGAGGIGITDAVGGADSARWYDDGTHTTFTTDNDFVLSDDVTLGDTINTVFLPRGTRLILADTSGADSLDIYHDGTNLIFDTNEPITLGGGNVNIYPGDTLFIASATFTEFSLYASGDALYVYGTGSDNIHLVAGNVYVDCDLIIDDGNLIVADGQHLIVTDGNEADSIDIYDDGDTARFEGDNPFDFNNSVTVPIICANVSDTVASATIVTLGNYNNFVITGTANMDSIDTAGAFPNWGIAYIQFTGIASANGLTDGKNLKLEGNFVHNADDIMVLQRRGDIFYEISRSAN